MERVYDADGLIDDYERSAARRGRLNCPEVARLRQMQADGATFNDMDMACMCDRGPWLPIDTIAITHRYNTPADTAEIQEHYAWGVTMHDWAETRPMLEHLLMNKLEIIAPGALRILLGWMRENHPDFEGFIAIISDRLPAEIVEWLAADGLG